MKKNALFKILVFFNTVRATMLFAELANSGGILLVTPLF
jgi:hypothetical protein